jgi:hypothetical protein
MTFNHSTNVEIIPGTISAVLCFTLCFTVLFFPHLRSLRYIELVFYVAFNDMIGSIGIAIGPTHNGSFACWFQGLTTNYNFLSSILWTTVITYQVYVVVHQGTVIKDLTFAHLICWLVPLFTTLLPLTTNTYANADDEADWCFIANRSDSPSWSLLFWIIVSFYGILWTAFVVDVSLIIAIFYRFYKMKVVPDKVLGTVRKLISYPILLVFCWTLETVFDIYSAFHSHVASQGMFHRAYDFATVLAISQGSFFVVVFYSMNPIIYETWRDYFVEIGWIPPPLPRHQPSKKKQAASRHNSRKTSTNTVGTHHSGKGGAKSMYSESVDDTGRTTQIPSTNQSHFNFSRPQSIDESSLGGSSGVVVAPSASDSESGPGSLFSIPVTNNSDYSKESMGITKGGSGGGGGTSSGARTRNSSKRSIELEIDYIPNTPGGFTRSASMMMSFAFRSGSGTPSAGAGTGTGTVSNPMADVRVTLSGAGMGVGSDSDYTGGTGEADGESGNRSTGTGEKSLYNVFDIEDGGDAADTSSIGSFGTFASTATARAKARTGW